MGGRLLIPGGFGRESVRSLKGRGPGDDPSLRDVTTPVGGVRKEIVRYVSHLLQSQSIYLQNEH